jgi:ABC-type multidrug transport system fused ATPase/permease subunit
MRSASLDVETEHNFFEFLKTLKGDLSVIMIAHRLSTLKDCERIIFMDNTRIADQGTFEDLYRANEKFRSYIEYSKINVSDALERHEE